jgi:1-acyl-sn-glycerol-3-phosphate acyltransferase
MQAIFRQPLRLAVRFVWFALELVGFFIQYFFRVAFKPESEKLRARTLWLQASSRRTLRILNATIETFGEVPPAGLLVCNHLSYLDILAISATHPAVFVAKKDVRGWPLFGTFATLAGTVFVNRERRTEVGRTTAQMQELLNQDVLLVLFPEGTSSDGATVLPFKSSLLEPVAGGTKSVTAGLISYALGDGKVEDEICYWRDMTFFPHLINLFSKKDIRIRLRFTPVADCKPDRKELATQLHREVLGLKPAAAF